MIAYINGIVVQGTPEEIEHYRTMTAPTQTTHNVHTTIKVDKSAKDDLMQQLSDWSLNEAKRFERYKS